MNYYQVQLEGKNFRISFGDGEKVSGFFTTRWVKAGSPEAAAAATIEMVKSDKSLVRITKNATGSEPKSKIHVAEIAVVNWLTYLTQKPGKGYSFYLNENEQS